MKIFRDYGLLAVLMAMTIVLCACGVKPNKLAQPQGTEPNEFPRPYPMPESGY